MTITPPFMACDPVKIFVGREREIEELHQIMVDRKIGAITGAAGTGGKTQGSLRFRASPENEGADCPSRSTTDCAIADGS